VWTQWAAIKIAVLVGCKSWLFFLMRGEAENGYGAFGLVLGEPCLRLMHYGTESLRA